MRMSGDFGVWVGALFALAIYSSLWKDNPAYRVVEAIFVGVSAGIAVVVGVQTFNSTAWIPITKGNTVLLLPCLLGLLLYARYFPSVSYLNRAPLALLMGTSAGVVLRGSVESQIVGQISATMVKLTDGNSLIIFLGTLLSLCYFFLTYEIKGSIGWAPKVGRLFMMAAFGAAFGNTVMGRVSAAIGRFQFIFLKWLGLG